MAKNLKRDYLQKLQGIKTLNGFKVDLGAYIYGFAHGEEYPALKREISRTAERVYFEKVYFFRYYNGTAEICKDTYSIQNDGERVHIITDTKTERIETATRYSLKRLVQVAETL